MMTPRAAAVVLLALSIATGLGNAGTLAEVPQPRAGWKETPELRITVTSSDWARIMFDDFNNTHTNGIRVDHIPGTRRFLGDDSNDHIDREKSLTYVDIIHNATVIRAGDFVGLHKGDNDYSYTRTYVGLILDINASVSQRYFLLVIAGAGVTTFQIADKASGVITWQGTVQGNSFTEYQSRTLSDAFFFPRQTLDSTTVLLLAGLVAIVLMVANPVLRRHDRKDFIEWNGL